MRNTRARWIAALAISTVIFATGAVYFLSSRNQTENQASSAYRMAPDFDLKDASGGSHRLSEFRGKVVLVHFWASWCPPCLGEIPTWVELADQFKGRPLQLVAVSVDDSWAAEHRVLPSERLSSGVLALLDPTSKTAEGYGTYAFPETYLVDGQGRIITKWVGPQEWKSPQFLKLMDDILKAAEAHKS